MGFETQSSISQYSRMYFQQNAFIRQKISRNLNIMKFVEKTLKATPCGLKQNNGFPNSLSKVGIRIGILRHL